MKKRADGRYCKQIVIGYKPDGKQIRKSIYGKTIKEVEKLEREARNQLEYGIALTLNENITLSEWSEIWLDTYKENVSYNTKSMYTNAIHTHITPVLGNIPLNKLKPVQIQHLLNSIVKEGHSRTAEIVKLTLKQLLNQAVYEGYITRNVAQGLSTIKHNSKEKRTLTDEEIQAITTADLNSKQRLFIDIMRYCGLRKGETLALTREDINLEQRSITVNKNLYFERNDSKVKEPKSKAGYRTIPIIDALYCKVKAYLEILKGDILFPMSDGKYMSKTSYRKFWQGIIKKINDVAEEPVTFTAHICRHTYATSLYCSNVDIKTAQYLLGHSSLQMTLGVYTHIDGEHIKEEIEKLNKYVSTL